MDGGEQVPDACRRSGIAGSSLVTAAAGNGVDSGIQVVRPVRDSGFRRRRLRRSGRPGRRPAGRNAHCRRLATAPSSKHSVSARWLCIYSPEQERNFADFLPDDYRDRSANLMCGEHANFEGLDCPLGLIARAAADEGRGPIVGLGILDITGEKGRLGGGIYDMPGDLFKAAVAALEA